VFLIVHGDSDCDVPSQQSQILYDALQAAGASVTFTLVPGAGHDADLVVSQAPIALDLLESIFGR
jgi:acetyl esterase/lipase